MRDLRLFKSKVVLSASSIIALFLLLQVASAQVITVHQGESIQAAVDAAKPGYVIEVENGIYSESVDINKPLTLRGIGYPAIDAMGNCTAVILSAGETSIEGFRILNSGQEGFCFKAGGIYVNSSKNTISGNRLSNNTCGIAIDSPFGNIIKNSTVTDNVLFGTGISLQNCYDNLIEDNVISHNQMSGIIMQNSSSNILRGNQVFDNAQIFPILGEFRYMAGGICLLDSENNTLRGNSIYKNYINFGFFIPSANDIDDSNLVEGKPVRILKGISGVTVSAHEAGMVFCMNCSNITLNGLTLMNNTASIWLDNTTDSIVRCCNLKNSTFGIVLYENSLNIEIENNTIEDCINGVSASGANNTIASNIVRMCESGISLSGDHSIIIGNVVERCGSGISLERDLSYIRPKDIMANRIIGNTVNGGIIGIGISDCTGNTLSNNSMYGNLINLYMDYMSFEGVNEIDTSNLVDGKKVYYLKDIADLIIDSSSNAGMIFCKNSSNLTLYGLDLESCGSGIAIFNATGLSISGCHISGCMNGIAIYQSIGGLIEDNKISNNGGGISISNSKDMIFIDNIIANSSYSRLISDHLNASNLSESIIPSEVHGYGCNRGFLAERSDNITLLNNTIEYSDGSGIQLEWANKNTFMGNRASHNEYGLKLSRSEENRIYSNAFIDNEIENVLDEEGSNRWDNGTTGNYYSDINCTDLDGDGICELSYSIPGGSSIDRYPLAFVRCYAH